MGRSYWWTNLGFIMGILFWWGIATDFRSERENKEYIVKEFLENPTSYQIDTIYIINKNQTSIVYNVKKIK